MNSISNIIFQNALYKRSEVPILENANLVTHFQLLLLLFSYLYDTCVIISSLLFTDIELSKLDEKLLRILAWQRLQQLIPKCPTSTSPKKNTVSDTSTPTGNIVDDGTQRS